MDRIGWRDAVATCKRHEAIIPKEKGSVSITMPLHAYALTSPLIRPALSSSHTWLRTISAFIVCSGRSRYQLLSSRRKRSDTPALLTWRVAAISFQRGFTRPLSVSRPWTLCLGNVFLLLLSACVEGIYSVIIIQHLTFNTVASLNGAPPGQWGKKDTSPASYVV